jgi:hypothetical protein
VTGSRECGDEPLGSNTMELVRQYYKSSTMSDF